MQKSSEMVEGLFKAGAHYGYSKTRRHASMVPFIFTTKNRVDIIDIEKTEMQIEKVLEYIKGMAKEGKKILFVGIKPESKGAVLETALALDMPYVCERWIGGALTNWPEIKKRIAHMEDLKSKKEKGELEKYTKKERLLIDQEIEKMTKNFGGLVSMTKTPDALFIVDSKREAIALTEAHKMNLPVIALANTDCNLKVIEHAIVMNDASVSSISFVMNLVKEAFKSVKA